MQWWDRKRVRKRNTLEKIADRIGVNTGMGDIAGGRIGDNGGQSRWEIHKNHLKTHMNNNKLLKGISWAISYRRLCQVIHCFVLIILYFFFFGLRLVWRNCKWAVFFLLGFSTSVIV